MSTAIAKSPEKKLSPVDKAMLDIMSSMDRRAARLENLLPPDMPVERFKESVRLALAQNQDLLNCEPGSVLLSVMKAAKLGIDVAGGALGHGALVPYGSECTFVPMYKGLVALAVTSGVVKDMTPVLVYEKDHFLPVEGDTPHLDHRPYVPRKAADSRGDIIAAYTRVILADGTRVVKGLLYADDIARIEAGIRAKKSPWNTPHRPEMVKKSTVRNAFKTLGVPSTEQAARLREALAADVEAEGRDVVEGDWEPSAPPASGVEGLKRQLQAKGKAETVEPAWTDEVAMRAMSEKQGLPITHPDAQPPEPGAEG